MKKITILLVLLTFVLRVMGQVTPVTNAGPKGVPVDAKYLSLFNSSSKFSKTTTRSTTVSHWVNYSDAINSLVGGHGTLYNWPLFPDSNEYFSFNQGTASAFTEKSVAYCVGQTFNAYSSIIDQFYSIIPNAATGYTLDSLAIPIRYTRLYTDTSDVDTLLINVYQGTYNTPAFPQSFFTALVDTYYQRYFGVDTVFVPQMYYLNQSFGPLESYYTNGSVNAPATTIKIYLHQKDTAIANSIPEVAVPGGLTVAGGNLVGFTMAFKPGYPYAKGDTINLHENYMGVISLDENRSANEPFYAYLDNNDSYIVIQSVQYNQSPRPNGWDSSFIPMNAFFPYNGGFPMHDHDVFYHIQYDTTSGIQSVNSLIAKQSIYPNPASDVATLSYTLNTGASVKINVYDVTGNLIESFDEGTVVAGLNTKLINTKNLSDGVYMVSVEANGAKSVSKLIVAR